MTVLYEDDNIIIRLPDIPKCLFWKWKKYVPQETYKELLEKIYNFTREHGCDKVIMDLTDMKARSQELQQHIETNFFPRMIQLGVLSWANVKPAMGGGSMNVKKMDKDLTDVRDEHGVAVLFFDTMNEARNWLKSVA